MRNGIELLSCLRNSLQKVTRKRVGYQWQSPEVITFGVLAGSNRHRFPCLGASATLADGLHLEISNC